MTKEIRDTYLLVLLLDTQDFQREYSEWPSGDAEVWIKGKVIDYGRVRYFLNNVN